MNAAKAPLLGMAYFILNPRLWLFPLLGSLLSLFLLLSLFIAITVAAWPHDTTGWRYALDLFRAFGYGTVGSLLAWAIAFPFVLALFFESMLRRILRSQGDEPKKFVGLSSSLRIVMKTWVVRIVWPAVGLIATLFFGPLGLLLGQVGIGHLAMIDACDLVLALQGKEFSERIHFYKSRWWEMLLAGAIGGCMSLFLGPTIIGWIFWIPGLYIGALLWIKSSPASLPPRS